MNTKKIESLLKENEIFAAQRELDAMLAQHTSDPKNSKPGYNYRSVKNKGSQRNDQCCFPEVVFDLIGEITDWTPILIGWNQVNMNSVCLNQKGERHTAPGYHTVRGFHIICGTHAVSYGYYTGGGKEPGRPRIFKLSEIGTIYHEIPSEEFWRVISTKNFGKNANAALKKLRKEKRLQEGKETREILPIGIKINHPNGDYSFQPYLKSQWHHVRSRQITGRASSPEEASTPSNISALTNVHPSWEESLKVSQKLTKNEDDKQNALQKIHRPYTQKWERSKSDEERKHLNDAYKPKFQSVHQKYDAIQKEIEEELRLLVVKAAAEQEFGQDWQIHCSISELDYRTQGLGASSYAKNSAKSKALALSESGIQSIVVLHQQPGINSGRNYQEFQIWIKIHPDIENFIPYMPKPPFKEIIRGMLKNGANPMVYYPFLSWESIKSEFNLDFQGNDIQKNCA